MPRKCAPYVRMMEKVAIQPNGCWVFTGAKRKGYGTIRAFGRANIPVHRLSYVLHVGDIPDGLCVLHKCDVPPCVNPLHLFLGSHADNTLDRDAKGRRNPTHRLSDRVRSEIIKRRGQGFPSRVLMLRYGLERSTVNKIFKASLGSGEG